MSEKLNELKDKLNKETQRAKDYLEQYVEAYIDLNALCCMCEVCGIIHYRIHTDIIEFINADSIRMCLECSTELKRNLNIEVAEQGTYMFDYESKNPKLTWRINKGFNKIQYYKVPIVYAKLRDTGKQKPFKVKSCKKALEK